jgi:hypothetical protein
VTLLLASKRGKKSPRIIKPLPDEQTTPEKKQPEELKALNESDFAKKLEQVRTAILAGKISAEASIERLSKTVVLTDAQKQAIRGIEKPEAGAQADPDGGIFD